MAYTPVLGTGAARRGGSSPLIPTNVKSPLLSGIFALFGEDKRTRKGCRAFGSRANQTIIQPEQIL